MIAMQLQLISTDPANHVAPGNAAATVALQQLCDNSNSFKSCQSNNQQHDATTLKWAD
jgi:hypothetical protein